MGLFDAPQGFLIDVMPGTFTGGTQAATGNGLFGNIGNAIKSDVGDINSNSWSWLGNNGILPTAFMGLQTLGGFLNYDVGRQQLELAKDQFDFSRNVANANLNNSVENYYNAIKNANRVGYALQGGYARKAYGADNQDLAATKAADEATKNLTRHV